MRTDCVNGTTPPGPPRLSSAARSQCGFASDVASVFVGRSPFGPWTQRVLSVAPAPARYINGVLWPGCDGRDNGYGHWTCNATRHLGGNPTAAVLPNGTTVVLFRTYFQNRSMCHALGVATTATYPGCTLIAAARAPRWDAAYEIVGGPIVPVQQEDPHIYVTRRGFHAVFHGMDPWPSAVHVGRHAYSVDGLTWHGGDVDAFNATVALRGGGAVELARRERPELLHDGLGRPAALISGATLGAVGDQSFTLAQPVGE